MKIYNLLEQGQRNYDFEIIKGKFKESFSEINEKQNILI